MARLTTPSPEQLAIFEWGAKSEGCCVVIAVAGSGKTTTIVELAHHIQSAEPYSQIAFVAFNKPVAEELKERLPARVNSSTLNSMGHRAWTSHIGRAYIKVEVNKSRFILSDSYDRVTNFAHGHSAIKLVALAKSVGLVPKLAESEGCLGLTPDTDENWLKLIEHYSVECKNEMITIAMARDVLTKSILEGRYRIDYDDQLYLPIIFGAKFTPNDWLMVDEAQDVNLIQRQMLRRGLKPEGRLVAVGDPAQAIYGFRGADTASIANIKKEFKAIELPLTVSHRCPRLVVVEARKFCSYINSSPTAADGIVQKLGEYNHAIFDPTDVILCRNTAPLVVLIFKLLRHKVGAKIRGREIGVGIINLVEQMKAQSLDDLSDKLDEYRNREVNKLLRRHQDEQADNLNDKVDTVMAFIVNLDENNRTIPGLISAVKSIFDDKGQGLLTLSTVHKAKGLEWNRVFILDADTLMPSKYAVQPWQLEQERNLQYVAVTRARKELYYITTKGFKEEVKMPEGWQPSSLLYKPTHIGGVNLEEGAVVEQGKPVGDWKPYVPRPKVTDPAAGVDKSVTFAPNTPPPVQKNDVEVPAEVFTKQTQQELTLQDVITAIAGFSGEDKWKYSREVATKLKLKTDWSPDERINHMRRMMEIKKVLK